jgi:hypothetical protein
MWSLQEHVKVNSFSADLVLTAKVVEEDMVLERICTWDIAWRRPTIVLSFTTAVVVRRRTSGITWPRPTSALSFATPVTATNAPIGAATDP